jgi:hypothetical protein
MNDNSNSTNLFWTGGWDSTFRLLQLVVEQARLVQPYYIIDPNRLSLRHEIKAMSDIEQAIYQRYPDKKGQILPTITAEVNDIAFDDAFDQVYQAYLQKRKVLDTQFYWMARFCLQHGITGMEICTETKANPRPGQVTGSYFLEPVGNGPEHRIADQYRDGIEYQFNRFYRYPIYGMTKMDMKVYADKAGWSDLMAMTWFCHYPVKGRYPCGTCLPCDLVLHEGLGYRIPRHRRLYARLGLEKVRQAASTIARRINPHFHQWNR